MKCCFIMYWHVSNILFLSDFLIFNMQKLEGYPSGSMVDFACDANGYPVLAVSDLAVHTKVFFCFSSPEVFLLMEIGFDVEFEVF